MKEVKRGSNGGKAMAPIIRAKALEEYYKEPSICKNCGEVIRVKEDEKPGYVRRKKFCTHSCAAKYTNARRELALPAGVAREKSKTGRDLYKALVPCSRCGVEGEYTRTSIPRLKKVICQDCSLGKGRGKKTLGKKIEEATKGEVFEKYASWQAARSSITREAIRVFQGAIPGARCLVCGYDKHVEVCHIESVSSFNDEVLILEINSFENLVGLCPNHHWEFDNELLAKDDLLRRKSEADKGE